MFLWIIQDPQTVRVSAVSLTFSLSADLLYLSHLLCSGRKVWLLSWQYFSFSPVTFTFTNVFSPKFPLLSPILSLLVVLPRTILISFFPLITVSLIHRSRNQEAFLALSQVSCVTLVKSLHPYVSDMGIAIIYGREWEQIEVRHIVLNFLEGSPKRKQNLIAHIIVGCLHVPPLILSLRCAYIVLLL